MVAIRVRSQIKQLPFDQTDLHKGRIICMVCWLYYFRELRNWLANLSMIETCLKMFAGGASFPSGRSLNSNLTEQSKGSPCVQIHPLKPISRRQALAYLGVTGSSIALSGVALAGPAEVVTRINDITSGASGNDTLIMLDLPEIAENGNAVKVAFDIDSPMTADNYVKAVHILADGNPEPDVATFNFSPAMGACYATTRMRLSKTQNVHVIAAFSDGSFGKASAAVKVTIGGCGG